MQGNASDDDLEYSSGGGPAAVAMARSMRPRVPVARGHSAGNKAAAAAAAAAASESESEDDEGSSGDVSEGLSHSLEKPDPAALKVRRGGALGGQGGGAGEGRLRMLGTCRAGGFVCSTLVCAEEERAGGEGGQCRGQGWMKRGSAVQGAREGQGSAEGKGGAGQCRGHGWGRAGQGARVGQGRAGGKGGAGQGRGQGWGRAVQGANWGQKCMVSGSWRESKRGDSTAQGQHWVSMCPAIGSGSACVRLSAQGQHASGYRSIVLIRIHVFFIRTVH